MGYASDEDEAALMRAHHRQDHQHVGRFDMSDDGDDTNATASLFDDDADGYEDDSGMTDDDDMVNTRGHGDRGASEMRGASQTRGSAELASTRAAPHSHRA